MSQNPILDTKGKETKKIKVIDSIFNVTAKPSLIKQAVLCLLSNSRQSNAHTKTRGEVRGGGRKPWKQKGTGRARAGSSRSPIWSGGGITFGPRNTSNFSKQINQKMRRKALFAALTDRYTNKKLIIIEDFTIKEPKTKTLISILENLPCAKNSVLIILPENNINLELSANNLEYVKIIHLSSLNILDILRYEYLLTTEAGMKAMEKLFSDSDKEITKTDKSEDKSEKKVVKAIKKEKLAKE